VGGGDWHSLKPPSKSRPAVPLSADPAPYRDEFPLDS